MRTMPASELSPANGPMISASPATDSGRMRDAESVENDRDQRRRSDRRTKRESALEKLRRCPRHGRPDQHGPRGVARACGIAETADPERGRA